MGRLIDADKLLEETRRDRDYARKNGFMDMYYERQTLIDRIKAQPTAYDIDKVVEELELHSFELGTDTLPAHYVRLNEAIEIIKQGGVSDDICEWKQDNMCETVYRVCGGFSTTAYQTDFEFCPYCGKKIKVIQNDN